MRSKPKTSTTTRATPAPAAAGTDRVETARLTGEPLGEGHHADLCTLLSDPRVGETLGGVLTPPRVADRLAVQVAHWADHGFGHWLWRARDSGELVGRGGLQRTSVDGRWEVEVGWAVVPELWGRGYATELGLASVEHAFERLGIADVVAFTLPHNRASRRVMEKLGFEYEKDIEHAGMPHVLYRLYAPGEARA
jgi:RimJ/RimL family protein N-acetyltransferase